ncbi:RCC1/BLIP-II [Ascodesmis nigricans]|uniref:RCC1/BLIP-II n=1 Tax=Ascodesmis nigricans TaxID=341454 RepID=A0A4S2N1U5_9PEZI|nr:RCC1/BLIP-II [Ascodesmis nigricans]
MFRPTSVTVRACSRPLARPQISANRFAAARRNLHSRQTTRTFLGQNGKVFGGAVVGTIAATATILVFSGKPSVVHADAPTVNVAAHDAKRSAQHAQIQHSLSNPGVYAWGDNSGGVIDPTTNQTTIKRPIRLHFFDNKLLRDLALSTGVGAAVDDQGNVLLWGRGYSADSVTPEVTLKGKDIKQVQLSDDMVLALSKNGTLYKFPISKELQLKNNTPEISYHQMKPDNLGYFEKIQEISTGADHVAVLTNKGRVFSAAVSYHFPDRGQLGVPGIRWETRSKTEPIDKLHEVKGLQNITQIASGDFHTIALEKSGRVFSFGDNRHGQCGVDFNYQTPHREEAEEIKLSELYPLKTSLKVTKISAGGLNSFFIVDVDDGVKPGVHVLGCGTGINGSLGNGLWTHSQGPPTKLKALSDSFEYDEKLGKMVPIRLSTINTGATHSAAIMGNKTVVGSVDSDFGRDVLWWGCNEHYQLGTGKRTNSNVPVYIGALDPNVVPPATTAEFTGSPSRGRSNQDDRTSGVIGRVEPIDSGRTSSKEQVHRFQLAPKAKTKSGQMAEQAIVCGRGNTAVFMKCA